jgi:hypothetical protein
MMSSLPEGKGGSKDPVRHRMVEPPKNTVIQKIAGHA